MAVALISHFHWDREWYRPFETYRGRLVDAVDRVLDLLDADPGFRFVLDGQAILLEDYLAVRPDRRAALVRGLRDGRLAAGPWYVQPDVLLPSGEALVRNLLIGREVAGQLGPVSHTGYVPDSFGHPAALPQILAGFGITTFVYWRGNGSEIDATGARYRWVAPDGSSVHALLLPEGYFNAACLPDDPDAAASGLAAAVRRGREAHGDPVLLMNGFDHMLPDATTAVVAERLSALLGEPVARVLLECAVDGLPPPAVVFSGELLGARLTNLLPGVWSTRMPIKLANRRCETLLEAWGEPWATFARVLGLPDERPAIARAWKTLLQNHAHDSICGCSLDAVAEDTMSRFASVEGLARATITRVLERMAGLGAERRTPWTVDQEVVVFNPSPHPRTDVVRIALDPHPPLRIPLGIPEFPPLGLAASDPPGFAVDGHPVRVVASDDPGRATWLPGQTPFDVELVAANVPPFGCRRYRLVQSPSVADVVDDGRTIDAGDVTVAAAEDGTLRVAFGAQVFDGLCVLEDSRDRGDSYDAQLEEHHVDVVTIDFVRRRHPSGLVELAIRRELSVGAVVTTIARLAPGVRRVDLTVHVEHSGADHRLRLGFPTGRPVATCRAATTFGIATRSTTPADATGWVHPAPTTFPHQGWIAANDLTVVAPGLPEAEVRSDGTIWITVLRAVGWIARYDLPIRPIPAGPMMRIDGAQIPGSFTASLALVPGDDPTAARDAEVRFWGVIGGDRPLLADEASLLSIDPPSLLLSAVKPAQDGSGMIVRVCNPGDATVTAELRAGFPILRAVAVRLDEAPADEPIRLDGAVVRWPVPPFATRSIRLGS